jgi:hypothetical protein
VSIIGGLFGGGGGSRPLIKYKKAVMPWLPVIWYMLNQCNRHRRNIITMHVM